VTNTKGRPVPAGPLGALLVDLPSTYRVTNVSDAGPGSLRQAVADANETTAEDKIVFDPTVFNSPHTITLTSRTINIHAPTVFDGPGASLVSISGNNASRIFYLDGPGQMPVRLSGVTLTAGRTTGFDGAAVLIADEMLTVDHCSFTNNTAMSHNGGAIAGMF